jgi:hypothetical protein
VKIKVTAEDIATGVRCDSDLCAVAQAIYRQTRAGTASVGSDWIAVDSRSYETPFEVAQFIDKFDDQEPVEPFEFELDLPIELIRGGN